MSLDIGWMIEGLSKTKLVCHSVISKVRPHRFGGEGVLIGGQTATLNAQSHLLI